MKVLSLFGGKYEVDEKGHIFSNARKIKIELVGKVNSGGHRMIIFTISGKKIYKTVHRIIAEAFIPNPNNLPQVNHKDGNKLNNAVKNLERCTARNNLLHCRDNIGSKTQKITFEIADEIRRLYKTGNYTQKQIGDMFDLKTTEVGYIIQNKRWVNKYDAA